MTTQVNIYVDQGIDFSTTIDLTYSSGAPIDISTSQFFCRARALYSSANANTDIIGTIAINDLDTLTLSFPAASTVDKKPGKYVYDLVKVDLAGSKEKLLSGLLFVISTVTETA